MTAFVVIPGSKRDKMIKEQQMIIDKCLAQIAEWAKWLLVSPKNITNADDMEKVVAEHSNAVSLQKALIEGFSLQAIADEISVYILEMSAKRITQETSHQRWLSAYIALRGKAYAKLMTLIKKGATNID